MPYPVRQKDSTMRETTKNARILHELHAYAHFAGQVTLYALSDGLFTDP